MLAVVQFPIVDGRLFAGVDRLLKPAWGLLREGTDFVPRFGGAKVQSDFENVPAPWRDDAQYVSARWAIRIKGVPERLNLSDIHASAPRNQPFWVYRPRDRATGYVFAPAFRRLFSDGLGLARLDIGFWVLGGDQIGGTDILRLVRDLVELETDVPQPNMPAERRVLWRQGKPLTALYFGSTMPAAVAGGEAAQPASVRVGAAAVFIDAGTGVREMPHKPAWFRPMAESLKTPVIMEFPSRASIVPVSATGGVDLAYTTVELPGSRIAVWMIGGPKTASRSANGLRHCLLRLHASRQVLFELQRLAATGKIPLENGPAGADSFGEYVNDLVRQVLRPSAFGANQMEFQKIISLYDLGEGGREKYQLETAFDRLPLNRQVKSRAIQATRITPSARVVIYQIGEMTVTNTGPTMNITQTGSGSITIHELTQVAGDYIRQSKDIAQTADETKLREALDHLRMQVESLAKQTADPADQELAARKLKQLTEEAAASKPDHDFLKVTGKGLIEAAKTVAEMVSPITTAVKGVLAILGLAL